MVKKAAPAKQRSAPEKTSHLSAKLAVKSTAALTATAFSPPSLHLALFASTVQGLDAYRIRVHDTTNGRLRCECVLEKGVIVSSLAWGVLPPREKSGAAKKKRKRLSNGAAEENSKHAIVAAATNQGTILLFSPSEGAIVGALEGGHISAVRHFTFTEDEGRGWSCGVDGKLVEWDIGRKVTLRIIPVQDSAIQRVAHFPPYVLAASHTIYALDYENPGMVEPPKFTANSTPIHSIITSSKEQRFLSAAESDRFINVFSFEENKHLGALVAESDVKNIGYYQGVQDEILCAVTADGVVELFKSPFVPVLPGTDATSGKRKTLTRSGEAKIRVIRPDAKEKVSITDAALQGDELVVAWVESGVNVMFQKLRWTNPEDGSLVLSGTVDIAHTQTAGIGSGAQMNGAKEVGKTYVDQASTVVTSGADMQDVDMEDADEDMGDADVESSAAEESEAEASDNDSGSDGEPKKREEPSFADRFEALEVTANAPVGATALLDKRAGAIGPPSAGALTSVLTQALRTDDQVLLESCLHTTDSDTILATIRKLSSPMAVTLLQRLTERLARRPGRAQSLGTWIRWTLVAHGGYLVTLPDLVRTLSGLHATLNQRAAALPRLLALQGRLDMLRAQVELRHEIRSERAQEQEEDPDVLYIEGELENEDSEAEAEAAAAAGTEIIEDRSFLGASSRGSSAEPEYDDDEDEEGDESSEAEEDVDAFLDLEASEASEDEEKAGSDEPEEGSIDWDDDDTDKEGASDDGDVRPVVQGRTMPVQGRTSLLRR